MFNVNDFLDRAKSGAGQPPVSDYRLAQLIGVTKQAMSNYRRGALPEAPVIVRLCEYSHDDPEHVVACIESMRAANDPITAEMWKHMADRLRRSSLAIGGTAFALAAALGAGSVTRAESAPLPHDAGRGSVYYVKRRRILRWSDSARRLSPASTRHAAAA